MKVKCKLSFTSFGFIDALEVPVHIEKDKEYLLEFVKDDKISDHYKVYDDNSCLTTISESELELFFEKEE